MALGDKIRRLGSEAVGAGNPVAVMFGTVVKVNPLEVNVDQRFTLEEDFLVVTERLQRYEIDLKHKHDTSEAPTKEALLEKVVIRKGLQVGDSVLLLRVQGGQKYVVWDRVVKS
ncbi:MULTISPECIES: DUF2577 domain-containing protein [Paenibacillus]|uniref:DUF2577 domain-containing protein n=2 Tax=Paenibacillus TaxID=44249 RepID=A0A3S9UV55_9BACL|nr:DUF2577 domain-containing protein [Paenibacillus lutimineralis]AZS14228.1 DUF2577 domain-containing protein [Paenibacillus lutimineralis]